MRSSVSLACLGESIEVIPRGNLSSRIARVQSINFSLGPGISCGSMKETTKSPFFFGLSIRALRGSVPAKKRSVSSTDGTPFSSNLTSRLT